MTDEKIKIRLHALNWTEGDCASFDILLSNDGEVKVDWGDGHLSSCHPHRQGERLHVDHCYGNKARVGRNHFVVIIEAVGSTIEAFNVGCADMAVDDIDFSQSPSIESLNMSWLGDIDLSPLIALKHLVCIGSQAFALDLRRNTCLESLDCHGSNVKKLLLSNSNKLKSLDCSCCCNLQDITLSNDSQLSRISISPSPILRARSWEFVQKIIEKNHGEFSPFNLLPIKAEPSASI